MTISRTTHSFIVPQQMGFFWKGKLKHQSNDSIKEQLSDIHHKNIWKVLHLLILQDKFHMIFRWSVEVRINHFQIEFVQKVSLDCYRRPAPHMSCQLQIELEKIMQGGEKWETFCQTLHSG